MTGYVVYDVFTDRAFGGNQLAVIPDATGLAELDLQRIAREFNYSESTFVYPPDDPAHSARVRIFTPTMEVPFAGHPTIGTAIALSDLGRGGDLVLELGVGPIPCRVTGNRAEFRTGVPLETGDSPTAALIAECLGLPADAVRSDPHPPVIASVGLPFAIAALRDRAALAAARPVTDAFRRAAELHPGPLDFAVLATWAEGDTVHARMFAPLDDIPEDPATGSAAAAYAALTRARTGHDVRLTIRQGEDMGRPSLIHAAADKDGVTIAGQAVKVMEGRLLV